MSAPVPPSGPGKKQSWLNNHLWQIQPVRDIMVLGAVFGLLWLGYRLSIVTVPLLLALLLAYLFEPLVARVTRRGRMSRQGAAAGILVLGLVIVVVPMVLGGSFAVVQGARFAQSVARDVSLLQQSIDSPNNAELRSQVRERGNPWLKVRDYVVEQQRRVDAQRARSAETGDAPKGDDATPTSDAIKPAPEATSPLMQIPRETTNAPIQPDAPAPKGDQAAPRSDAPAQPNRDAAGEGDGTPPDAAPNAAPDAASPAAGAAADKADGDAVDGDAGEGLTADGEPETLTIRERFADAVEALAPEDTYLAIQWAIGVLRANAESIGAQLLQAGGGAFGAAINTFGAIARILFSAFLTGFFFYFMCVSWPKVVALGREMIPDRNRERTVTLIGKMDRVIASFIRGRLTICAILIVYYITAYWAIGIPAPFIIGAIVGALTIVPYAASVCMFGAFLLLALAPYEGFRGEWWWVLGAPVIVHGAQQMLDDYVLTPAIQGKNTNMDTPTILFASIAGGALAGVYGLLLAIPVAACIKILLIEVFWPHFKRWKQGRAADPLPLPKE